MKRLFILLVISALAAFGQTAPVVMAPTSTVNAAALPSYTIGFGPSWDRGAAYPYSADVTLALHVGQSQWYSWSTVSTPIAPANTSTGPIASTITTGGAWIPVQSATGSISLVTIVQAGFSTVQANSTVAPAFTGSVGLAIHVGTGGWYLFPYAKAGNASTSSTSGALATVVLQPGLQFMYGFSKAATPAAKPVTAGMMRKVMKRLAPDHVGDLERKVYAADSIPKRSEESAPATPGASPSSTTAAPSRASASR